MTRKFRSNRGNAIMEFAFVLPFMVIVVLGIIEFGVLFYNQAAVTNASREGARAGMTFETDGGGNYWSEAQMQTEVQQKVNDYLQANLLTFGPLGTITTTSTRKGSVGVDGINYYDYAPNAIGKVDVTVAYQHAYLTIPDFFGWGNTINLSAGTTMGLE